MPSFDEDLAQVNTRLRTLQRRLNLFAAQDALCRIASAVTATTAALAALAAHSPLSPASYWLAAATIAAFTTATALQLHHRWLSREQAVRFADRHAALDNRLSTLMFTPTRPESSTLAGLLLAQIREATPHWHADALAPRRVPRSAIAMAASVAALIVTSFITRQPAAPESIGANPQHLAAKRPIAPRPEPETSNPSLFAPTSPNGSHSGARGNAAATEKTAAANPTPPEGNARHGRTGGGNAATDSNLGDTTGPADTALAGEPQPRGRAASPSSPPHTQHVGTTRSNSNPYGPTNPHPDTRVAAQDKGSKASGEPDSGRKDPGGAGLFCTEKGESLDARGRAQPLPIVLDAAASVPGSVPRPAGDPKAPAASVAPQPPRPSGTGRSDASSPDAAPRPDAPLQKADVSPALEALVRKIFTREP